MNDTPERIRPEYMQPPVFPQDQNHIPTDHGNIFEGQREEYMELMMMYSCAIREVRTKLEVLNADLALRYERNPIEFISHRIKQPTSLISKMQSRDIPLKVANIEDNIFDVAGVRVICSFIDDIYVVAAMLTGQDDVTLLEQKDYIKNPKPNGYRSLHLIIEIPVFFAQQMKRMKVEVQIRTIAMDFWASLEHSLKYKQHIPDEAAIVEELAQCAANIAATDQRMMDLRNKIARDTAAQPTQEEKLLKKLGHIKLPKIEYTPVVVQVDL